MSKESSIIKRIVGVLPKSGFMQNEFFQSDSEIIDFHNRKVLFSMDDFTREDFFRDDDPKELGRNVAIATISDILASGGQPLFFAHSMSFNYDKWDTQYVEAFSEGISKVLREVGAGFIGGDLGRSDSWKYTGVAIGESEKPITRIGAKEGDLIFMTGEVGAGNMEATMILFLNDNALISSINLPRLKLNLRLKESQLIQKYATSCIDTSDGVLGALNTISELNNTGFLVNNVPYTPAGIELSKLTGKPACILLIGECGEYELLFTIKENEKQAFLLDAKKHELQFTQIGEVKSKDSKILQTEDECIDFSNFNISARDYNDMKYYLTELFRYVEINRK
ncbi:MAG: thiamine-phosphate kinase [Bacteroidales bacterium]|nr:thiamine-phosphate kinase [Bacteroidales bacterium]MCF8455566.1 thiamine-phosphate kinase [Bacteroidales bacterium]